MTLLIAIALLLGAGGTVAVADSARPGDLLFPVDRVVEEVRATFASSEGKAELKIKFAEERLDEIDSILDDESATTTPSGVSEEAKLNLSQALDILTMHLADIQGSASTTPPGLLQAISIIEARLQARVSDLPQELKIKIRDDRGRIELKTEEGKIKVKIESDGELEVEIEDEDEDTDEDNNKGPSSNSGSGKSATSTKSDNDDDDDSELEIEADVFTDITVVEVEIGGQKSSFTTSAKTRAAIVAEIVSRYPLFTTVQIDAALELEVEDGASSDDDNDADEEEDSDEDDEEDDDDSGSGGSNSGSSNN